MIRHFNRTKIIATVGPSCNTKERMEEMVEKGVDVFRFNFSHGVYEEYVTLTRYVKEINEEHSTNVGILADLQGPKIRIRDIENDKVYVEEGSELTITTQEHLGNAEKMQINYENFPKDVDEDDIVLIDDGKIELRVLDTDQKETVKLKVMNGGEIASNKGVNLPNTTIGIPSMTEKDHKDLEFAIEHDFNWVALSFVRSARDLIELKNLISEKGGRSRIIAKIEKPEAVENIDEILEEADALMVARGDLGIEMPSEQLPMVQKDLVAKSIRASKPVIIATQIMESMIDNPRPYRAEVTDVANSVSDGADCLMLSGETSIGNYPVRVIENIEKIIARTEEQEDIYLSSEGQNKWGNIPQPESPTFLSDAVCYNACKIAVDVNGSAIIGMTQSGYTGFMISSFRPPAKIYIFTNNRFLLNTLSLVWGARGFYYDKMESTDSTIYDVKKILQDRNYVDEGDVVVNTASMPIHEKGRTNMLKVSTV